jgi:hypothetical protein
MEQKYNTKGLVDHVISLVMGPVCKREGTYEEAVVWEVEEDDH